MANLSSSPSLSWLLYFSSSALLSFSRRAQRVVTAYRSLYFFFKAQNSYTLPFRILLTRSFSARIMLHRAYACAASFYKFLRRESSFSLSKNFTFAFQNSSVFALRRLLTLVFSLVEYDNFSCSQLTKWTISLPLRAYSSQLLLLALASSSSLLNFYTNPFMYLPQLSNCCWSLSFPASVPSFFFHPSNSCSLALMSQFALFNSAFNNCTWSSKFAVLAFHSSISPTLSSSLLFLLLSPSISLSLLDNISLHFLIQFSNADFSFCVLMAISLISRSTVDLRWFSMSDFSSSISLDFLLSTAWHLFFQRSTSCCNSCNLCLLTSSILCISNSASSSCWR